MGAVRITELNPKFNGGHIGLPPSSIHRMTGWVGFSRIMTYAHGPHSTILTNCILRGFCRRIWLIFVCWEPSTFRTHEIFEQLLTAADSPTSFARLVRILFSYGSRCVRNKLFENKMPTKNSGFKVALIQMHIEHTRFARRHGKREREGRGGGGGGI